MFSKENEKFNVIDLFSGCGGFSLGFVNAGFEPIAMIEFDKNAVTTYKENFNIRKNLQTQIVDSDVRLKSTKESLYRLVKDVDVDVVVGGFPCQGFSVSGNRNIADKRNSLYVELLNIVKHLQPKFIVMENVKGLISMDKSKILENILNDFRQIGYNVDWKVLNSADFGVPQHRERIIFIGNNLGLKNSFPKPTHSKDGKILPKHITVKDTIGFLEYIPIVNNNITKEIHIDGIKITNHVAKNSVKDSCLVRKYEVNQKELSIYLNSYRKKAKLTVKEIDKYFGYAYTAGHWFRSDKFGSIPSKNDYIKLKKLLNLPEKYDKQLLEYIEKPITFEQSLRITNWNRPSDTITATQSEIHINKERRLSIRESAILQSFPNDFVFTGSLTSQQRQVGNAVPPLLAEKIAIQVRKALQEIRKENP